MKHRTDPRHLLHFVAVVFGPAMLLSTALPGVVVAQGLSDTQKREALLQTAALIDGEPSPPRRDLLRNPFVLKIYEQLLTGEITSDFPWDAGTVLRLLADSDEARYVPLFVRFSREARYTPSGVRVGRNADYGLARHAARKEARQQLLRVLGANLQNRRGESLIASLSLVNDEPAREVLRTAARMRIHPITRQRIAEVLAGPPLPRGKGHWPCYAGERPGRTEEGAFGCVKRPRP